MGQLRWVPGQVAALGPRRRIGAAAWDGPTPPVLAVSEAYINSVRDRGRHDTYGRYFRPYRKCSRHLSAKSDTGQQTRRWQENTSRLDTWCTRRSQWNPTKQMKSMAQLTTASRSTHGVESRAAIGVDETESDHLHKTSVDRDDVPRAASSRSIYTRERPGRTRDTPTRARKRLVGSRRARNVRGRSGTASAPRRTDRT